MDVDRPLPRDRQARPGAEDRLGTLDRGDEALVARLEGHRDARPPHDPVAGSAAHRLLPRAVEEQPDATRERGQQHGRVGPAEVVEAVQGRPVGDVLLALEPQPDEDPGDDLHEQPRGLVPERLLLLVGWHLSHTDKLFAADGGAGQPIQFNHARHTQNNVKCIQCHPYYESTARAGMPGVNTCRRCHEGVIRIGPEESKIEEAYRSNVYATFWSLLPPVIAIALALIIGAGVITWTLFFRPIDVQVARSERDARCRFALQEQFDLRDLGAAPEVF